MIILLEENINSLPVKWDSLPADCKTVEAIKAHFAPNAISVVKFALEAEAA